MASDINIHTWVDDTYVRPDARDSDSDHSFTSATPSYPRTLHARNLELPLNLSRKRPVSSQPVQEGNVATKRKKSDAPKTGLEAVEAWLHPRVPNLIEDDTVEESSDDESSDEPSEMDEHINIPFREPLSSLPTQRENGAGKGQKAKALESAMSALEARLFQGKGTNIIEYSTMDTSYNDTPDMMEKIEIPSTEMQKLISSIPLENNENGGEDITKTLMVHNRNCN
jgi:hypothetical protein